MCSQIITAEQRRWSVARYNSNNAWLYNHDNGNLNNNNLYNDLTARPLDYDTEDSGLSFYSFLDEIYQAYMIARKTKRGKKSQMEFEVNLTNNIMGIAIALWNREYIPSESICFMIERPKRREVIAAWFGDRVVQTWYCMKLEPFLEEFYDPNSYSCRKGKGGLRAALDLKELIRQETKDYILDNVWIAKNDIKSCFMTVDTKLLTDKMVDFIKSVTGEDEHLRDMLCWLTRIIYMSLPQEHCIIKNHRLTWQDFPKEKSSLGKTEGIAIGNKSNQQAVLFLTTFILSALRDMGYKPIHYTDDTANVIRNVKQWKRDEAEVADYIKDELHWIWHPDKRYLQHWSKGVEFLGFKIRGDRMLPSDRIAHNYIWKMKCYARKADTMSWYVHATKEHVMQVVNSYTGLFKWCNTNRLRETGMSILKESAFAKVYNFHNGQKVTIKPEMTQRAYFTFVNRSRKRKQRKIHEQIFN